MFPCVVVMCLSARRGDQRSVVQGMWRARIDWQAPIGHPDGRDRLLSDSQEEQ